MTLLKARPFEDCGAAVFCGGRSRRMGFDKALHLKGRHGTMLLADLAGELSGRFGRVILVTDRRAKFEGLPALDPFEIVEDRHPGAGPAGALETALQALPGRPVFVLACDMPRLDWAVIERLWALWRESSPDAALPRHREAVEPLYGFYGPGAGPVLAEALAGGAVALKACFPRLKMAYLDLEPRELAAGLFQNLNTPDDLIQAGLPWPERV